MWNNSFLANSKFEGLASNALIPTAALTSFRVLEITQRQKSCYDRDPWASNMTRL